MSRPVSLDLDMLSKLIGYGDGDQNADPIALAINAFSSLERRLWIMQQAAEGEGSGVAGALNCERERCNALATLFQDHLRDKSRAESAADEPKTATAPRRVDTSVLGEALDTIGDCLTAITQRLIEDDDESIEDVKRRLLIAIGSHRTAVQEVEQIGESGADHA